MPFRSPLISTLFFVIPYTWANLQTTNNMFQNTLSQTQQIQKTVENATIVSQHQNVDKWSEWGLTREDWTRYEELRKGARGIWSPNLDPLTTLGVEARSESERERYAELLARKEFKRTENEFAFQKTYNRVFEKMYPNILPFEVENDNAKRPLLNPNNRLIYFTRTDCGTPCQDDLIKLFRFANNTPIDIYIVDSEQKDDKIRTWAIQNGIDSNKVQRKQITLNHDSGYWLKYAQGKMPVAFQIQGDGLWKSLAY